MTDPTIPTTEAGRKHVLNGWDHDEREQRRALVLAIEAEAAASALSALRAEVAEGVRANVRLRLLRGDVNAIYSPLAVAEMVSAAVDDVLSAKAEPEGESRDQRRREDGESPFVDFYTAWDEGESR